jgi:hypothetical protein
MRKSQIILAIDPSGSFEEGKGTTGWCLFDSTTLTILDIGEISASHFTHPVLYWQAHIKLINKIYSKYDKKLVIVCEDYILYANKASSQINSRMETPKLIAIIQNTAFHSNIYFQLQLAGLVAKRWADDILEHKGYIKKCGKRSYSLASKDCTQFLSQHERDALRHALHYSYFGKEKK